MTTEIIVQQIELLVQDRVDKALEKAVNVAEIEANEYKKRIAILEEEIISLRGNSTAASNLLGKARDEIKELKKQLAHYADVNQNQ